ncbi:uncharacterized protein Aud_001913 [Aspergillus udagawae]|uniref:C2H2-type domain-containing protein n=1 Tax=Aspergillus udagawae TaxID=91492 RepID=A0A8E0R060_9EURO|nr:uncharacterized protein Aud_001913 [Aspergillus udagawae]GIC94584.1 hypothetical protein Aud_001913 [Aspergillus udagawae]
MDHSSGSGITPGNQDGRSLFEWERLYPQAPRSVSVNRFSLFSLDSIDSGVGLHGRESPNPQFMARNMIAGRTHVPRSLTTGMSRTYICDLCDESGRNIFYYFNDLKRHKETKHEITDHIQQPLLTVAKEAVSKTTNQVEEPSTPSEPGHDVPFFSNASVCPSQRIDLQPLSKGIRSPLGSDTTDSGDSEMYADEESLFDDQDAHVYIRRKWNESTIQQLEHIYKQELYSLVGSRVLQHCNPHREYGTSSSHVSACSFQSGPKNGTSSGKKRKRDDISHEGNHGDHDDSNDDGDGSQEPSKRLKASKLEDRALRFACPFFKRHPESFRICGMSDHENSSRVKQHISRKHRMPIYCPRCSETFKAEQDRDTHVRDADCPVGPKANFICATAEQLRKLSRRNVHQTDRDNWNAIYKILFPDDPLPESPYLDPFVSYEVNLVREAFLTAAPVAVRTAIQHVIPEELTDTLQEELERILRSTHAEVFDQILHRMREDRESPRVDRTTTQSSSQVRVSSTPDSGIGSTIRSGSSQDEPELTLNSQDRLTSFGSGSFDLQNDGSIPFLPLFPQGFDSSDYHMGHVPQSLPAGNFGDLSEYLEPSGDSFVTGQS